MGAKVVAGCEMIGSQRERKAEVEGSHEHGCRIRIGLLNLVENKEGRS